VIRKSVLMKYARSLAEVAVESGIGPKIERDFQHLNAVARQVPDFMQVLKNPVIPTSDKLGLMDDIGKQVEYHPYFLDFCKLLIENHRIAHLQDIFELYLGERDDLQGVVNAQVYTPRPLDHHHQEKLIQGLKEVLSKEITLDVREDPTLIGGLKVNVDGTVYDGSVKRQLERLKQQLASETF